MPGPTELKVWCFVGRFMGLALLNTTNEITWYWGNLVVYVNSYRLVHNRERGDFSPWFLSIFITSWAFAVILAGYLSKRLSQWTIVLIGSIIYNIGMFSGYLAVQSPVYILDFTMGIPCGFGYGMIQAMVYVWVKDLAPKRTALAYGVVSNFLNVGALLINEITTLYLNPGNLQAEFHAGHGNVFAQTDVVDAVPSLFVILGILTTSIHALGLVLTLIPGTDLAIEKNEKNPIQAEVPNTPLCLPKESETMDIGNNLRLQHYCYNSSFSYTERKNGTPGKQANPHILSNGKRANITTRIENNFLENWSAISSNTCKPVSKEQHVQFPVPEDNDVQKQYQRTHPADHMEKTTTRNFTLKQAMRSKDFYLMCFALTGADLCYIILLNYYKIFGQMRIQDDYLLTEIGSANCGAVLLMRLVLGLFIDRYGFKNASVLFTAGNCVIFGTYYLAAYINKWVFGCWTIFIGLLCSGFYIIFPVATLRLFGSEHFTVNYGAIMSTTVLTNMLAPVILDILLLHFGWFGLFLSASLLNLILLFGLIVGLTADDQTR